MKIRNILPFILLAVFFAACEINEKEENCLPRDEMMEVIVHEYHDPSGELSGIAATTPDGSVTKLLYTDYFNHTPVPMIWPSVARDGESLLFTNTSPGEMYVNIYSIRDKRFTLIFPDTFNHYHHNSYNYYEKVSFADFSNDMQEIFGFNEHSNSINVVNLSKEISTSLIWHSSNNMFGMTGDNSRFLFIEKVRDDENDTDIYEIKSVDRSGRDLRTLKAFDLKTQGEIVALATVPSPGSREFIYLQKTPEGKTCFVKTDADGGGDIVMDSFDSPYHIHCFTTNAQADRIAYFETSENLSTSKIIVRNYTANRLTEIVHIQKDYNYGFEISRFRAHLSVIKRDIWDMIPEMPEKKILN